MTIKVYITISNETERKSDLFTLKVETITDVSHVELFWINWVGFGLQYNP